MADQEAEKPNAKRRRQASTSLDQAPQAAALQSATLVPAVPVFVPVEYDAEDAWALPDEPAKKKSKAKKAKAPPVVVAIETAPLSKDNVNTDASNKSAGTTMKHGKKSETKKSEMVEAAALDHNEVNRDLANADRDESSRRGSRRKPSGHTVYADDADEDEFETILGQHQEQWDSSSSSNEKDRRPQSSKRPSAKKKTPISETLGGAQKPAAKRKSTTLSTPPASTTATPSSIRRKPAAKTTDTNTVDEHIDVGPKTVAIMYPGFAKDALGRQRMVDSLGGVEMLTKVVQSGSRYLELKLRYDEVGSNPVAGDHQAGRCLLVRVKKTIPAADDSANGQIVAEVVSVIDSTFRFSALADYQFMPAFRSMEEVVVEDFFQTQDVNLMQETESCDLIPPQFSYCDMPLSFPFELDFASISLNGPMVLGDKMEE